MILCAFNLVFLQLICKASLIYKLDLKLTLSIILKETELWGKACCGVLGTYQKAFLSVDG